MQSGIAFVERMLAGGEEAGIEKRAPLAWAIFDVANLMFYMNILSLYFPLWVTNDMDGKDGDYGLANSLSMALIFCTAPLLGALTDQAGRRKPFLIVTSIGCAIATALLGTGGLIVSLGIFVVANYFFQAGSMFYDTLLPSVSTPRNRGSIGGLSLALGNIGMILGVLVGLLMVEVVGTSKPTVFKLTALLFILFALPCFFWVRERRTPPLSSSAGAAIRQSLIDLRGIFGRARRDRDLKRFLLGRVFYSDAANTMLAFMTIYVTKEIGFTERQAQILLVIGIFTGIGGALYWGRTVDRIGPRQTLNRVLFLWVLIMLLIVAVPLLDIPKALFWIAAPFAGFAIGGLAASDRPLILILAPPRHLGQVYGLFAMVGRFAAILGPLLWTTIVDWLDWGRPAAVLSLMVMLLISIVLVRPVSDKPRDWPPEDLIPA